jgi:exopolysaccharide production protein ExoY
MLIQMPRGSSDQQGSQNAGECSPFEAALRRDLASAPVISYEATLGGWSKRAVDLTITILAAPIWLSLLVGAALWSKIRHPAPVFQALECVGYGGRHFKCYTLRVAPPSAVIEKLRHPNEAGAPQEDDWSAIAERAEDRRTKWRRAFERLPQLVNVLIGDMALVGPSPLTREQLAPLRTAKRYYLSARPGVVGVSGVADAEDGEASQYKIYALGWSHATDGLLLCDALGGLLNRGELWSPTRRILTRRVARVRARRREAATE